ncbi:VWA domain-containing protein [Salinisphaera aquimarina]|uniref:VWA domain-containing protein n=1 Tax=Salinisphaera aquimarina TaxID=2094031 RepID=A0ABV7EK65_9GAMM
MERTLASFVRALRMADVRVSTAETLDAFRVAEMIGWQDRQRLKDALGAVLAKSQNETGAFDACFDQFFYFDDLKSDDGHSADDAIDPNRPESEPEPPDNQAIGHGEGQGGGGGNGDVGSDGDPDAGHGGATDLSEARVRVEDMSAPSSSLGRLLMADDRTALAMAISHAAGENKLEDIRFFTQKGLYTRRILEQMGRSELIDEIITLDASTAPPDQRLATELRTRSDRLREQVRDHVERQFLLHADAHGERLRADMVRKARVTNVARYNDPLMRRVIARMARQLVAAHSRKRRITKRGTLDLPRMMRKNMRYDGNMVELAWKSKRIDKPRVFAVCDVSGSVASYARFMLMFLYSLEEVLPKVRAFAFSSQLGEVTDLFKRYDLDEAIKRTLAAHGQGSTDYGRALADFEALALDDVDRRSTVLILGDARNNEGDPRTDLLRKIYQRSQRVIWLNPEQRVSWDSGDSEMCRYRAHCHQVNECGSLEQLERVVSDLLRAVT